MGRRIDRGLRPPRRARDEQDAARQRRSTCKGRSGMTPSRSPAGSTTARGAATVRSWTPATRCRSGLGEARRVGEPLGGATSMPGRFRPGRNRSPQAGRGPAGRARNWSGFDQIEIALEAVMDRGVVGGLSKHDANECDDVQVGQGLGQALVVAQQTSKANGPRQGALGEPSGFARFPGGPSGFARFPAGMSAQLTGVAAAARSRLFGLGQADDLQLDPVLLRRGRGLPARVALVDPRVRLAGPRAGCGEIRRSRRWRPAPPRPAARVQHGRPHRQA